MYRIGISAFTFNGLMKRFSYCLGVVLVGLAIGQSPRASAMNATQIEQAIAYGQDKVNRSLYTGCNGGTWRMGGTTTYERHFDGTSCGQKVYVLRPGWYGFDCSGLIYRMFQAAGITVPSSSAGLATAGVAVNKAYIARGDLLVYGGHHVAMYLGRTSDGKPWALEASPNYIMEQATASDGKIWRVAQGVMAVDASKYLNSSYYVARRI